MSEFESRIKLLMSDKLEKYIAEEYNLTEEMARDVIRKMSFAEHTRMTEASADFGNQTTNGPQPTPAAQPKGAAGKQKANSKPNTDDSFNPDGSLNTSRDATGAEGSIDLDGALHDITVGKRYGNDTEVTTADGKKMRVPTKTITRRAGGKQSSGFATLDKALNVKDMAVGALGKFAQNFNRGRQMTTASAEHDELNRLRELAGIEETCSAGATGAGSIAAAPSIVGNTAHTPTDQLRARLRRKKEKKK
jgi:hypothetical protein